MDHSSRAVHHLCLLPSHPVVHRRADPEEPKVAVLDYSSSVPDDRCCPIHQHHGHLDDHHLAVRRPVAYHHVGHLHHDCHLLSHHQSPAEPSLCDSLTPVVAGRIYSLDRRPSKAEAVHHRPGPVGEGEDPRQVPPLATCTPGRFCCRHHQDRQHLAGRLRCQHHSARRNAHRADVACSRVQYGRRLRTRCT